MKIIIEIRQPNTRTITDVSFALNFFFEQQISNDSVVTNVISSITTTTNVGFCVWLTFS